MVSVLVIRKQVSSGQVKTFSRPSIDTITKQDLEPRHGNSYGIGISIEPEIISTVAKWISRCRVIPWDWETVLIRESSSSSPDEVVTGASPVPAVEDSRAHHDLLHRGDQNLGIQIEEVSKKGVDAITDVLSPSGLAREALPLINIYKNMKTLW